MIINIISDKLKKHPFKLKKVVFRLLFTGVFHLQKRVYSWNKGGVIVLNMIKDLPKNTVIGEFAGRDSVAAIIKALEDESITSVLPIATFAPTEYGDFDILKLNYEQMIKRIQEIYGNRKNIYPLTYYSNPDLWSIINGRFLDFNVKNFGFYTPCIGCHAYFHLVRIPLALKLGSRIISGERESHDGRIKLNQTSEALDAYIKIAKYFNVDLIMPIRYMEDGDKVKDLIGWEWEEGKAHQSCAFSGNYIDPDGSVYYDKNRIQTYLEGFLYPICKVLGEELIKDPDVTRDLMIKAIKDRSGLF